MAKNKLAKDFIPEMNKKIGKIEGICNLFKGEINRIQINEKSGEKRRE